MEEAGERDANEMRAWSGTASPAALWKTVASAAAMLKLALAMISAAFRTMPFSMSMQLCPNATMSLHSPSIFDVVSSITPIVSCIINNRLVGEKAGAMMQRWRLASPLVALGHDAASPEHGHMGMWSWRKTAGLPQSLIAEGADGVGLVGGARAADLAVRRGGGSATSSSWARVVTTTAKADEDGGEGGFGGGRRRGTDGGEVETPTTGSRGSMTPA